MTKILYTDTFKKGYKALVKKYPSLQTELKDLIEELHKNPKLGTSLGSDAFKIRLSVKSKGRGKSGGLRIITFFHLTVVEDDILYLVTIYDKADLSTISDKELKNLIKSILFKSQ